MKQAEEMYHYHVWANQTLINKLKELPRGVYEQQVQSVFPTVAKVMAHIYFVDLCWFEILSGREMRDALEASRALTEEVESKSLEELEQLYVQLAAQYRAFLSAQNDLERVIVIDNPYAGVRPTRLSEMLLQIVNHATYHRGNVTAMLHQMGHASVMTEYALFWYQGAPQAAEYQVN
ncbi:DinB family protein [Paenibacillus sp. TAB 01]|uniref:DinB family protein n=1 Tax=Paenibacillus sp. TAB 01 TaxID=3368988 RepID=UPI00374FF10D